jgi:hypothetical protein
MCIVCRHNQIKDIDRALLTGTTLTSLNQKYGFSTSALHRHQEHLMQKMARAQKRFHDGLHQGLYCKLNIVMELVLHVVRGANAGGDFKLFLQASREVTRIISLMHKMAVQLEPEMIYCLMASPQWDLQDSLLPNSFQALSATRQTLAVNLFAHCPEPEPETIPDTTQESPLETQNRKLATLEPADTLADPNPDLLQSVNFPVSRQPDSPQYRKLQTLQKKSAKDARN